MPKSHQSYRSIDARRSTRRLMDGLDGQSDFDDSHRDGDSDSDSDDWEEDFSSDGSDDDDYAYEVRSQSEQTYGTRDKSRDKSVDKSFDRSLDKSFDRSYPSEDIENMSTANSMYSWEERQLKEEQKIKQKLTAIIATAVCAVLVLSSILLGVALNRKEPKIPTPAPSVSLAPSFSDAPTISPTSSPTVIETFPPTSTQTSFPTATTTVVSSATPSISSSLLPSDGPSLLPSSLPSTTPTDRSESPTAMPSDVPSASTEPTAILDVIIPEDFDQAVSADTYVLILPDGAVVENLPENFGSSSNLLVRSRNPTRQEEQQILAEQQKQQEEQQQVQEDGNPTEGNLTESFNNNATNSTGDGDGDDVFDPLESDTMEPVPEGELPADASAYALLSFDMTNVPWYRDTNTNLLSYNVQAYVCLNQVLEDREIDPWGDPVPVESLPVFSMCRIKPSSSAERRRRRRRRSLQQQQQQNVTGDLEELTSETADFSMPEDCYGGKTSGTTVDATAETVCVNVTKFVRKYPPFAAETRENDLTLRNRYLRNFQTAESEDPTENDDEEEIRTRLDRERILQETADTTTGDDYLELLFMFAYTEKGKQASAKFYSGEDVANAPFIAMLLTKQSPPIEV
eukprot:jgi/Psemu1/283323/fgenesh1_pg.24_\